MITIEGFTLSAAKLLEARAVTLDVLGFGEHTRFAHITLVITPILFPLRHVIKSRAKLFGAKAVNDSFAAVACNFD
jgi:hypothetical protein